MNNKNIYYETDTYIVERIEYYETYNKLTIKSSKTKLRYYLYDKEDYSSGDFLFLSGELLDANSAHYKNGYDQKKTLFYNDICGVIKSKEIKRIGKTNNIYFFHDKLLKYINHKFDKLSAGFIGALIIGEKSGVVNEANDLIKGVGISHLFVISGLHIGIISSFFTSLFKKFKTKEIISLAFTLFFLIFYNIIIGYSISCYRVISVFVLNNFFKKTLDRLTSIDKLSLSALFLLIFDYKSIYKLSFLLSYSIVYIILLIEPYLSNSKSFPSFIKNNLLITSMSILVSLPILANTGMDINLISVLSNLIFIPFVTYLLLPLSFVTLLFPFLNVAYRYLISIFLKILSFINQIDILRFNFPYIIMIFIFIYYLIILILIKSKKPKQKIVVLSFFLFFIFVWKNISYLNFSTEIDFLDLAYGDATFLSLNNNQANILIDTGETDENELCTYLRLKGVNKIDVVFITHSDSDHIGGLEKLVDNFKIDTIYISYYDDGYNEYLNKSKFKNIKIKRIKAHDEIKIHNLKFAVLSPNKKYSIKNNNSLVLLLIYDNLKILFTGDIEKEAEEDLINEYKNYYIDILKVPHHGSKTSSNLRFLNNFHFKIGIAENGYKNKFGFPHSDVVDRYDNAKIKLYNTINRGTITLRKNIFSKKFEIICQNST